MIFLVFDTEEEVLLIEKIYRDYCEFIYRSAYRIVGNKCDAEDALQITVKKLAYNVDKIRDMKNESTKRYIWLVARSAAIDIYKLNAKENENKIREMAQYGEAYTEKDGVLNAIISKENVGKIKDCIKNMNPKYQNIIFLKTAGKTNSEIADILGIENGLVRKRLERARRKIMECLKLNR